MLASFPLEKDLALSVVVSEMVTGDEYFCGALRGHRAVCRIVDIGPVAVYDEHLRPLLRIAALTENSGSDAYPV